MESLEFIKNSLIKQYKAEYDKLKASADALANTSARTCDERDAQLRRLGEYTQEMHEIDVRISCVKKVVSDMMELTPKTSGAVSSAA